MPHPNVQSVGMVDQGEELHHRVIVIQWLPDAHQNDVGDWLTAVYLGKQDLVHHLRRSQIPDLSSQGRGTKGTPHAAAHLTGDTYRISMLVPHQNCFNTVAIGQLPEVFDRPIQGGNLLPGHLGLGQKALLLQLLTKGLGQVAHLPKGGGPPVEPTKDLLSPKGGLSLLLEPSGQLLQCHGF